MSIHVVIVEAAGGGREAIGVFETAGEAEEFGRRSGREFRVVSRTKVASLQTLEELLGVAKRASLYQHLKEIEATLQLQGLDCRKGERGIVLSSNGRTFAEWAVGWPGTGPNQRVTPFDLRAWALRETVTYSGYPPLLELRRFC